jgi:Fe-S oxidoreductase
MAKMKAEFMNGWHNKNGASLGETFFGHPEKFYPLASFFAPLTNFMNRQKPVKKLLQKVAGIDARRNLPEFASHTFYRWYQKREHEFIQTGGKEVVLLVDLFSNHHEPEIAKAACHVLKRLGYSVIVPGIFPTGRPQISKGFLDEAEEICEENIQQLSTFADQEIPIVGLEPSEILTLRDEYIDLCSDDLLTKAKSIANNTFLWEEFLATELVAAEIEKPGNKWKVHVHGHCHTKALVGNDPLIQSFKLLGFDPVELQTGCCGMAGSFGYEKDKYEVSMAVGEQTLFPQLRELNGENEICSEGFSCRHQIADGVGKKAKHPAVIMWEAMREDQS